MAKLSYEQTLSKDQSILDLLDSSLQSSHINSLHSSFDTATQDQVDQCALLETENDVQAHMSQKNSYNLPQILRHELRYGDSLELQSHSQEAQLKTNASYLPESLPQYPKTSLSLEERNRCPSDSCSIEENAQIQKDFADILNQAQGMDRYICSMLNLWTERDLNIQNHIALSNTACNKPKLDQSAVREVNVQPLNHVNNEMSAVPLMSHITLKSSGASLSAATTTTFASTTSSYCEDVIAHSKKDLQSKALKGNTDFILEDGYCKNETESLTANHTHASCQPKQDRTIKRLPQVCVLNSENQQDSNQRFFSRAHKRATEPLNSCEHDQFEAESSFLEVDRDLILSSLERPEQFSQIILIQEESNQALSHKTLAHQASAYVDPSVVLAHGHSSSSLCSQECSDLNQVKLEQKTLGRAQNHNAQQDAHQVYAFQEQYAMFNQAPWVSAQNIGPNQDFIKDISSHQISAQRSSIDAVTACLVLMVNETDAFSEKKKPQDSEVALSSSEQSISPEHDSDTDVAEYNLNQTTVRMSRDTLQNHMYLAKAARVLKQNQVDAVIAKDASLDHSAKTEYYWHVASGHIGARQPDGRAKLTTKQDNFVLEDFSSLNKDSIAQAHLVQSFNELAEDMEAIRSQASKTERVLVTQKEQKSKLQGLYSAIRGQEKGNSDKPLHQVLTKVLPRTEKTTNTTMSGITALSDFKDASNCTDSSAYVVSASCENAWQATTSASLYSLDQPNLKNAEWSVELFIGGESVCPQHKTNISANMYTDLHHGHSLLKSFLNKFKQPATKSADNQRSVLYFVGSSHFMWLCASGLSDTRTHYDIGTSGSSTKALSTITKESVGTEATREGRLPQVVVSGADSGLFKSFASHSASFFSSLSLGFEQLRGGQGALAYACTLSTDKLVGQDLSALSWQQDKDFLEGIQDCEQGATSHGLPICTGHNYSYAMPMTPYCKSLALSDVYMGGIETYSALLEAATTLIGEVKALGAWAYESLILPRESISDSAQDYFYFLHDVAFDPSLEQNNVAKVGSNVPLGSTSDLTQASLGVSSLLGLSMFDMADPSMGFLSSNNDDVTLALESRVKALDHPKKINKSTSVLLPHQETQLATFDAPHQVLHQNGQFDASLALKNDRIIDKSRHNRDFLQVNCKGQDLVISNSSEQQDKTNTFSCETVGQTIQGEVLTNMTSLSADDSKQEILASSQEEKLSSAPKKESKSLQASYGLRKVLFAQDFGIQKEAQQRQDYASAFKVGDLETVVQDIKARAASKEWGEKLNCAPLVSKLAVHVCSRWLKRRCTKLEMTAPHDIQESESEIYFDTVSLLIQTMMFAMRADNKVNTDERQALYDFCLSLFGTQITNIRGEIDRCLTMPLDLSYIANRVCYAEERVDIFVLSAVILHENSFIFESYLENLAASLDIDPSLSRCLRYRAQHLIELAKNDLSFKDLDRLYSENRLLVASLAHKNTES